jgi:hypothetical protein
VSLKWGGRLIASHGYATAKVRPRRSRLVIESKKSRTKDEQENEKFEQFIPSGDQLGLALLGWPWVPEGR